MAAIVRSGSRRLAGRALLQRAPSAGAVLLLQRTSFPARWFMSSTKQQHALAAPESSSKTQEKILLRKEIQDKKEELYEMISATERSPHIHTDCENRELLNFLSAQIRPRPDDSEWHLILASKRRSDLIRPTRIAMGLFLGVASVLLLCGLEETSQSILREQQEADAAKEKELALA